MNVFTLASLTRNQCQSNQAHGLRRIGADASPAKFTALLVRIERTSSQLGQEARGAACADAKRQFAGHDSLILGYFEMLINSHTVLGDL
jgi:hypothetical protein